MNEISPTLIAQIATQLLNELPGASQAPKTELDARHMPDHVPANLPSGAGQVPFVGINPGAHPPAVPPTSPAISSPPLPNPAQGHNTGAAAPAAPNYGGQSSLPAGAPAALGFTPPQTSFPALNSHRSAAPTQGSSPSDHDGLTAFVRRVRSNNVQEDRSSGSSGLAKHGSLGNDHDNLWQRMFSAQSPDGVQGSSRPFDVAAIRRDFPILKQRIHGKPLVWFDNAATTQKPQSVIDAISRFYEQDNSNIHRAAHTLAARATDAYEQARQKVQGFLGASSLQEIIFVRGTTEGINLVAKTYGRKFFQPGDEIVLSTLEHHANIVPWQMVAKETGAVIRVIPVTDRGEIMLEEYQRLLGPRTKFVSLTHASNSLGTLLPVAEMTQMAKRYNARVLIDGAQSVAHVPVNVSQLGADFYVFSGHKIFGPTGIGAVFAKQEVQEIMPPWQGGGNMIRNVTFEETTFSDPPAKFEAGTPNIADAVGLGAALDYVTQLGLPNIGAHEHSLLEHATESLSRIDGLRLLGLAREKVGVLSFVVPERSTEEVGRLLDQEGIAVRSGHHCSQPSLRRMGVETSVRPSFSLYNTHEEVDHLAETLRRIVRR